MINGYKSTKAFEHYTVPEVVDEARGIAAAASIGVATDLGHLQVWEASPPSVALIRAKLDEIGGELSETDVKVIALAMDLREGGSKPIILTDDYGLQNVAEALGLDHSSVLTPGIKSIYRWVKRCPGCAREYPAKRKVCPVCGSVLRRTVLKYQP